MAAAMMQMTPMNGFPGPSGVQPSPTLLPVQAYRAGHQGSAAFAVGHAKRKEYHVLRVLGAGTKACVKLAKHNTSGQLVALKSIRKPALPRTGRRDSAKGFAGVTGSAGAPSSAAAAGSAVLGVAPSVDIAAASGSPSSALQPAVPNGAAVSGTINGSSGNGNSKPTMETEDYYIAEKEWKTEVSIMARVGHHENLPTLIDAFETNSKWYIAMTFCEGGDLLSRLLQIEHYSERHAASIMATICNAVHYLHSHGIAHRDLKPANLLMKDMSETSNLCIIDFNAGFIVQEPGIGAVNQAAAVIESGSFLLSKQSMQTVTGTPFYLAPEIVLGKQYTTMVDTWSLGCIAFQLLTGVTPFQTATSYEQLYAKILAAEYSFPDDIPLSPLAKDFVRSLLVSDPDNRASAAQTLQHPWIQGLVPAGYLMLLQQFNHEADPTMFPPPSRLWDPSLLVPHSPQLVSQSAGSAAGHGHEPTMSGRRESAEWRLRNAALAAMDGQLPAPDLLSPISPTMTNPVGTPTAVNFPTDWVMPRSGYQPDPKDLEFGQTLRSRWELAGRPGILQVPTIEHFFEHEELFGYQANQSLGGGGQRSMQIADDPLAQPSGSLSTSTPPSAPDPQHSEPWANNGIELTVRGPSPSYPSTVNPDSMFNIDVSGQETNLMPSLKRGLSQHLSMERAASGMLNRTPSGLLGGMNRAPSGMLPGRLPMVDRAASGVQVWCSPSGGLYLSEHEKEQLVEELLDRSEDEDDEVLSDPGAKAAADMVAQLSPDQAVLPVTEHVGQFPMLELLRNQAGTSTPLWEWETPTADYFGGPVGGKPKGALKKR